MKNCYIAVHKISDQVHATRSSTAKKKLFWYMYVKLGIKSIWVHTNYEHAVEKCKPFPQDCQQLEQSGKYILQNSFQSSFSEQVNIS